MATLEAKSSCQKDDLNLSIPMDVMSTLHFPTTTSKGKIFTGYYNGFGVEVRSNDEAILLNRMGCFGKGTCSRSVPKEAQNVQPVMRRRQYLKRMFWYKKYGNFESHPESDIFRKDVDKLTAKIISDTKKHLNEGLIDLVSSDESSDDSEDTVATMYFDPLCHYDKEDIAVIVPNSDSENGDYFAKLRPKCFVNRIKLPEKLMLTTYESFFLLFGLGCLQIINIDNSVLSIKQCWELFSNSDKYFLEKYIVYHYFKSKGYIVKPGIKFGGDFLLYKEGPEVNHADFVVLIHYNGVKCDWISIFGHIRVASNAVKGVLLAEVIKPDKNTNLPKDLGEYTVQEMILARNIPVPPTNDDIE